MRFGSGSLARLIVVWAVSVLLMSGGGFWLGSYSAEHPQPPKVEDVVGIDEAKAFLTYARDTHQYYLTKRIPLYPSGRPVDMRQEREWVRRYQAILNLLESMRYWYPYQE